MNKIEKRLIPAGTLVSRAAFKPTTLNETDNTISAVITTGYKGLRTASWGKFYEELSLEPGHVDISHLQSGRAKVLAGHDTASPDSVLGLVESVRLNPHNIEAKIRFSDDEISKRTLDKIRSGVLTDLSIGYSVSEYSDVSSKNDEFPTYRATKYKIHEVSVVGVGFDPGATFRNQENEKLNEVEIRPRNENQMTPEQIKLAERERCLEIKKLITDAELDSSLADTYIERGLSIEDVKNNVADFKRALEASKKTEVTSTVRVEVGSTREMKTQEGFKEYLVERLSPNYVSKDPGANQFRGRSLISALEVRHGRLLGESDPAFVTRVMSSSDMSYLLANSAEKAISSVYTYQNPTWQKWASKDTLRNYKVADRIKTSSFPQLLEVQENGEIKNGSLSDEREQFQLRDWARKVSFTRRMLVNDDLGELMKIVAMAGAAASSLENQLVYEILTGNPVMADTEQLFSSAHANLGTPGAVSDTTIGEAIKLMRQQTSIDGALKLNLSPKFLVCGPDPEGIARKYLAQINPNQASSVNPWAQTLELVVDAEITTNDYFFVAAPGLVRGVVLYHLAGQEQPRVESRVDFNTSAYEFKIEHACVAGVEDHRALVKNANAS